MREVEVGTIATQKHAHLVHMGGRDCYYYPDARLIYKGAEAETITTRMLA